MVAARMRKCQTCSIAPDFQILLWFGMRPGGSTLYVRGIFVTFKIRFPEYIRMGTRTKSGIKFLRLSVKSGILRHLAIRQPSCGKLFRGKSVQSGYPVRLKENPR